jgi:hypothetical protein
LIIGLRGEVQHLEGKFDPRNVRSHILIRFEKKVLSKIRPSLFTAQRMSDH